MSFSKIHKQNKKKCRRTFCKSQEMLHMQVENDLSFQGKFCSFPVDFDESSPHLLGKTEGTQHGLKRELSGKLFPAHG